MDDNGSLTNYTWDYENRLTEVVGAGLVSARYEYDVFGKRISKSVDGVTTYFLYDNEDIVVEYDADGTVAASYLHGQGIDEPIQLMVHGSSLMGKYYYCFDGLGSVTELTDEAEAVAESYEYDSFGNLSIYDTSHVLRPSSVVGNSYSYTGREYDSETGLYYYRYRYYDSSIGRFVSADLLGKLLPPDFNLYVYSENDPINMVDPYGAFAWPWQNPDQCTKLEITGRPNIQCKIKKGPRIWCDLICKIGARIIATQKVKRFLKEREFDNCLKLPEGCKKGEIIDQQDQSIAEDFGTVSSLLRLISLIVPANGKAFGCECSCKITNFNNTRIKWTTYKVDCCE